MKSLFLGAAAIAIIATAATAETPTKAQFVDKAGASDTFEIDSARLMVTSKNPAIMTFATQMLDRSHKEHQDGPGGREGRPCRIEEAVDVCRPAHRS